MAYELEIIPKLLFQARGNLTGNARDLWVAGIENFKDQEKNILYIKEKIRDEHGKSLISFSKNPLKKL